MKCRACGYDLHMDEAKCPHCGADNPYYKEHREDMEHYEQDYSQIKQDVYAKNGFFTKLTAKITLIAILVALELGMLIVQHNEWQIRRAIYTKRAIRNEQQYRQTLDNYEEDENYFALARFVENKELASCDNFMEYRKVYQACNNYYSVYYDFMTFHDYSFRSNEEKIVSLCSDIEYFYKNLEQQPFDEEVCFAGVHGRTMENLKKNLELMLVTYGGLTREEAQDFEKMSNARKQLALEEGMCANEE